MRSFFLRKKQRLGYLQWLASSEGPREQAYLKRFTPSARLLGALRLRHAFSTNPSRCREGRTLFLVPPHIVKARAIRRHAEIYGLSVFVETGTYLGDMVAAVAGTFERCITIELSVDLWRRASARFQSSGGVTCLNGDSSVVLADVLSALEGPALFWLDAHTSGGVTADAGRDPIQDELRMIFAHGDRNHVILIDDARGHRIDRIAAGVPSSHRFAVRNDIVRITPAKAG
jgi:hypothetical protein